LKDAAWKINEIEQELRAQIEMARKYIPRVSHIDCHMGFNSADAEIDSLVKKLAAEYKMDIDPGEKDYKYTGLWERTDTTAEQRIEGTIRSLKKLEPGRYLFVEHPGMNTTEMQAIWHKGYESVASDRDAVTKVFTSKEVMDMIQSRNIILVGYNDLK